MSDDLQLSKVRIPAWSWLLVLAGGAITYVGVGVLLEGARFVHMLEDFLESPERYTAGNPEMYAPFVLLFIPAVLGALGTRTMIRIVVAGVREGKTPGDIVKRLAWYLAGSLVLVVLAMYSSSKRSGY